MIQATLAGQAGPYLPADTTALFARLESLTAECIARLPADSPGAVAEVYRDRAEDLRTGISAGDYLFRSDLQQFVDGMFRTLIDANGLSLDPVVLISRSPAVNASSLGDGLFVINIGLLRRIRNSDELAFVFAHELSHDQLAHLARKLEVIAEQDTEASSERERERAMRRRLRREGRARVMEDLRDAVYENRRHSRAAELSADSLGKQYLARSGYADSAMLRALQLLRDYEPFVLPDSAVVRGFQTRTYPFKEKWIAEPAQLFGGSFGGADADDPNAAFWAKDSLSTHPDLEHRLDRAATSSATAGRAPAAHPFAEISRREIITRYLERGLSAHALCLALAAREEQPDEVFYALAAGKGLLNTYRSVREHHFDRHIPPTAYFDDPGASQLLRLLHQIRNSELKKLTLAYLEDRVAEFPDDPRATALQEEAILYFNTIDE